MNAFAAEAPEPARYRWLAWVLIVFVIQFGLILWLSDPHPPETRSAVSGPTLTLAATASEEILALSDPTLFALPHRRGFSGEAWLRRKPGPAPAFEWSEAPHWLPLPAHSLAAGFREFMGTNVFITAQGLPRPQPELNTPAPVRFQVLPERSSLRVEDQLKDRKLLTPVDLPAQAASELLSPTVVRAVVDEEGRPVSVGLLSGSGSVSADQYALDQARRVRFERVDRDEAPAAPHERLAWGRLVFEWLTVPVTATNPPAANLPAAVVAP